MNLMELASSIGVEGFLHCAELQRLVELAANKEVLEVGSYRGLSAWGMAIGARSVMCVDTFKADSAGQRQLDTTTTLPIFKAATRRYTNVEHFQGTSQQASLIYAGPWDFIFLDAMHTYEDVKADIGYWWPRVRAGGCMAFHDYGHGDFPGVKQAVDEVFGLAIDSDITITLRVVHK